MKPCWKELGLTRAGAALADKHIDALTEVLRALGEGIGDRVIREARFRAFGLPTRTESFQRKYRKQNGGKP